MRYSAFIFFILSPFASFAEQYICMAEQAAGFIYKNDAWTDGKLTSDNKYLVSFEKKSISIFGEAEPIHTNCEIFKVAGKRVLNCYEDFGEFLMSSDTMKYQRAVPWFDYVIEETNGTPNIEIGTCVKF